MIPEQKKKGFPAWAIVLITLGGCFILLLCNPIGIYCAISAVEDITHPHSMDYDYWIARSKEMLKNDREILDETCSTLYGTNIICIFICKPNEEENGESLYIQGEKHKYQIDIYPDKAIDNNVTIKLANNMDYLADKYGIQYIINSDESTEFNFQSKSRFAGTVEDSLYHFNGKCTLKEEDEYYSITQIVDGWYYACLDT